LSTDNQTRPEFSLEQDEESVYVMLAASQLALRTNSLLTLEFYLGGLYVVAFNRLAPYCRKPEAVNRFVAREYGITFPIWFYWASIIRAATSAELPGMHKSTPEVYELLRDAARSAAQYKRKISVLDLLFAVKESKTQACKRFLESGIDIEELLADSTG